MLRFNKILRRLGLIVLIVLASIGVSLGGGIPIPLSNRKEDTIEVKIELVESDKAETESTQFNQKQ